MLDYPPLGPYQPLGFPGEYLLVRAQELHQCLLLIWVEVGTYGEGSSGGPIFLDRHLLGFCPILSEQLLLLSWCGLLNSGDGLVGRSSYRGGFEGKLERYQSFLGISNYGEDVLAPGHLHEGVGRMGRCHKLSQSRVPEDGVVWRPMRAMSKSISSVQ